jgi:uncharacterized membrane protein YfhO
VYCDGKRLPLFIANHAFFAFRAPAGRHAIRLVFWPDSFSTGLAISGLSWFVVVAALSWRRGKGTASRRADLVG